MAATHLNRLRAFVREKGVAVRRTGRHALWNRETKEIQLPAHLRGRDALFTLLHEIGHVLVDIGGRFDSVDAVVYECAPTWRGRAWAVAEEWEAWEAGKRLADRMAVPIDHEAYDRYAAEWLATYVQVAGTAEF